MIYFIFGYTIEKKIKKERKKSKRKKVINKKKE